MSNSGFGFNLSRSRAEGGLIVLNFLTDVRHTLQEAYAVHDFIVGHAGDHSVHKRNAILDHAAEILAATRRKCNHFFASAVRIFAHAQKIHWWLCQGAERLRNSGAGDFVPAGQGDLDILAAHGCAVLALGADEPENARLLTGKYPAFKRIFDLNAHQIMDGKEEVQKLNGGVFAVDHAIHCLQEKVSITGFIAQFAKIFHKARLENTRKQLLWSALLCRKDTMSIDTQFWLFDTQVNKKVGLEFGQRERLL